MVVVVVMVQVVSMRLCVCVRLFRAYVDCRRMTEYGCNLIGHSVPHTNAEKKRFSGHHILHKRHSSSTHEHTSIHIHSFRSFSPFSASIANTHRYSEYSIQTISSCINYYCTISYRWPYTNSPEQFLFRWEEYCIPFRKKRQKKKKLSFSAHSHSASKLKLECISMPIEPTKCVCIYKKIFFISSSSHDARIPNSNSSKMYEFLLMPLKSISTQWHFTQIQ